MTPPDQSPLQPLEDPSLAPVAASSPGPGDWVHEVKQWYLTGSRHLAGGEGRSTGGGTSQRRQDLDDPTMPGLSLDD